VPGRLAQADALKAHTGPPGRPDGQTPSLGVLGTPGPRVFDLVVAAIPLPLDTWLTLTRPSRKDDPGRPAIPAPALMGIGRRRGMRGRIYGIGGAFLAPVLIGSGRKPSEVAPAALAIR
jgi:hypothetical protein